MAAMVVGTEGSAHGLHLTLQLLALIRSRDRDRDREEAQTARASETGGEASPAGPVQRGFNQDVLTEEMRDLNRQALSYYERATQEPTVLNHYYYGYHLSIAGEYDKAIGVYSSVTGLANPGLVEGRIDCRVWHAVALLFLKTHIPNGAFVFLRRMREALNSLHDTVSAQLLQQCDALVQRAEQDLRVPLSLRYRFGVGDRVLCKAGDDWREGLVDTVGLRAPGHGFDCPYSVYMVDCGCLAAPADQSSSGWILMTQ